MSVDNFNYLEISNKWIELANDTYRTYFKNLVWNQERTLELTKVLVGQADSYQSQGKGLAEEYAAQYQRAQELFQTTWEKSYKNGLDLVNQYRVATNTSINDLNERLEALQQRLEQTTKAAVLNTTH